MKPLFTRSTFLLNIILGAVFFAAYKPYSASAQLTRSWASYYGNDSTRIVAVQYDSLSHTVFVAGVTTDPGLATTGAHKSVLGSQLGYYHSDMFLARFDSSGSRLWCTYFGGEGDEMGVSIALDHAGNIILSGNTGSSTGIATPGSHMYQKQSARIFLAKFSPTGQQLWGTFYGSAQAPASTNYGAETATTQVAVDASNNVYLYSQVPSDVNFGPGGAYFTTPGTHQATVWPSNSSWPSSDVLVVKFNSSGQRLWGTFYGGPGEEIQGGIVVDGSGNVYLSGFGSSDTDSGIAYGNGSLPPDSLVPNTTYSFLAKLSSSGQMLWGGYREHITIPVSMQIDRTNHIYVFGEANPGSHLGTAGTHSMQVNGQRDVFLIKYDSSGAKNWGTYYGSPAWEVPLHMDYQNAFGVPGMTGYSPMRSSLPLSSDQKGIMINGLTTATSNTGIVEGCGYEGENSRKGFVARFNTSTGQLDWGSFYDGFVGDVSVDAEGGIYLGGYTSVNNIATAGSFQSSKPSNKRSGMLARMSYGCPQSTLGIIRSGDSLLADTGFVSYQWFRDGVLVQDSTINYLLLSGTGTYYVIGVNECNCQYQSSSLQIGVGIGDRDEKHNISVYPNPASGQVHISSKVPFAQHAEARLLDLLGRTVAGPLAIGGQRQAAMHLSGLNGVYFLQISNGGVRTNWKLVVSGQ